MTLQPDAVHPAAGALRRAAVLAAVALVALTGCRGGALGGETAARVLAGETLEVRREGQWQPVAVGDELPAGAEVRTGDGEARLELPDGEVWLGAEAAATLHGAYVELGSGELLARSDREGALTVRWEQIELQGEGAFRLVPGATPRVGAYRGAVEVRRPGESTTVPWLRQVALSARRLPRQAQPLFYRAEDRWDRELLAEAITIDAEVADLARGIDREYGTAPRAPAFYASFVAVDDRVAPLLSVAAQTELSDGPFGPPSEALITLFLAEAAGAEPGEIETAAARIAELRAAGARWGLVALEIGVSADELATAVDLGQERRLVEQPTAPAPQSDEPAPEDGGDASGGGGEPPGGGEPTPPPPDPDDEPDDGDDEPDEPGPVERETDAVTDVVDETLRDGGDALP